MRNETSATPSFPRQTRPLARTTRRSVLAVLGLGTAALGITACSDRNGANGSGGSDGGSGNANHPIVATSCYPVDFLVQRIGGEHVERLSLAKPGVDPHGLELSVREVAALEAADACVQIPGFQHALDDALTSSPPTHVLNVAEVITLLPKDPEAHSHDHDHDHEHDHDHDHDHEHDHDHGDHDHDHGEFDPHFWHDPRLMADVGDALAQMLSEISPAHADQFASNAETLRSELEQLDAELEFEFSTVAGTKTFVTSHAAFRYLAERYGLNQVGIAGIDPETEPSPKRLAELEKVITDEQVATVFFETTASPKVAQTLADNVGVETEELHNLETQLDSGDEYPAVMRENCRKLMESWN